MCISSGWIHAGRAHYPPNADFIRERVGFLGSSAAGTGWYIGSIRLSTPFRLSICQWISRIFYLCQSYRQIICWLNSLETVYKIHTRSHYYGHLDFISQFSLISTWHWAQYISKDIDRLTRSYKPSIGADTNNLCSLRKLNTERAGMHSRWLKGTTNNVLN